MKLNEFHADNGKSMEVKLSCKKTILYNTTVGAILQNSEQYLKKLRHVLETFKNRDDVVLWWRPHPLSITTFESMRPQLAIEYKEIVDKYKKEGWGIYDDTPDLHRAIAWTDAYYGDWSSVVALYQAAGKPVMIQNVGVLRDRTGADPSCVYISDNTAWISTRRYNMFYTMDLNSDKINFKKPFPNEIDCTAKVNSPLYLRPAEHEGYLYFPPYLAKEIAVYSIKNNSFEKKHFKNVELTNDTLGRFSEAVVYNNYIFFIPRFYPAIMRLDTKTKEIAYYSDWVKPLEKTIDDNDEKIANFNFPFIAGDTILLASRKSNAVVEFNMQTCTSVIYEVGEKDNRYNGICFDGENHWLSPRYTNTPAIKWNKQDNTTKAIELIQDENKEEKIENAYLPCLYSDGYIWIIPLKAKEAVKIDVGNDTVLPADEFILEDAGERGINELKFLFAQLYDNSIYTYNYTHKAMIIYNCKTKERVVKEINYPQEVLVQFKHMRMKAIIDDYNEPTDECLAHQEDPAISVTDYLDCLSDENAKTKQDVDKIQLSGSNIYNKLKLINYTLPAG